MNVVNDIALVENEKSLRAQEREIAKRFTGGFPWIMVIWGIGNTVVWLSLWPLVILDIIPLWLGFAIATLNIAACYLPSHDAQHYIIGAKGSRLEWFNDLVGNWSIFPLVLPHKAARITHLQHHRHTNDPNRDPDYSVHAPSAWQAIWKSIRNRQPRSGGGIDAYGEVLKNSKDPKAKVAMLEAILLKIFFFAVLAALALSGYAIEAALIWWLPRHIALTYIQFYLSWAPHHPGTETGRYGESRAFKSIFGNIASSGMQYHIVHHLYPNIPLTKTPAAYRALRPILEQRGCDVSDLKH